MTSSLAAFFMLVSVILAGDDALAVRDHRTLWLRNVHSGDEVRLRPFRARGRPAPLAWLRLDRTFRRARAGPTRTINPRLFRVLAQVQRHFGGRRLDLMSGYRVPGEGQESGSYHHVGRAADLRIEGVPNRELFEYCRTLQAVGCGLYPNGHHVHIDVRSRPAIWVDLAHRRYVRDPRLWLELNPAPAPSLPPRESRRRSR